MKNNENWISRVMDGIGKKNEDLQTAVLAHRLMKDMEAKSVEEVLTDHLPASAPDQLAHAAKDIHDAVQAAYANMDEQMTADNMQTHLNSMLDGLSCDEQGKWLVNLLNCAAAAGSTCIEEEPRWDELRSANSFEPQDVQDLIDMSIRATESHAGFLVRQEFSVMEHALDRLSPEVIEEQMNSGPMYAEAYAAAMYIISKQTGTQQDVPPYQMGLLAAGCVESSRILAQYHCHKLEAEEAFPKLKNVEKQILVKGMAFALRLGIAYVVGNAVLYFLVHTWPVHIGVILAVTLGVSCASFFGFSQERAVEAVTTIWNGVKSILGAIVGFLWGSPEPPLAAGEAVAVETEAQEVCIAPANVEEITV